MKRAGGEFDGEPVEITDGGDVVFSRETHERVFGGRSSLVVDVRRGMLELTPLHSEAVGGWLVKQRNAAGDRSLLAIEILRNETWQSGVRSAEWDAESGSLRVPLSADPGGPDSRPVNGRWMRATHREPS